MNIEFLLRQQPIEGRMLYVDMNSFFASVEQELKPELRGKPVGVCPFVHDATCIVAASIEAKRCGIRTGTSVREAKRLCPAIVLVGDGPRAYREYHRKIMESLDQMRCQVTIKSIDEAALQVPLDLTDQSHQLATNVKQRIYDIGSQLGCSVGIASNMFLAKMATKLHKPHGLTEIRLKDLEAFYETLKLTDLYGISWRMEKRLNDLRIFTPLDFYQASFHALQKAFGINGERWYLRLRGYEVDNRSTKRSIIGHQTTIAPQPAKSYDEVLGVASQLSYKAAYRLRAAELAARSAYIRLRFLDRTSDMRAVHTRSPFWDSRTCFEHIVKLLNNIPLHQPVRLVDVSFFNLAAQSSLTQSLFDDEIKPQGLSQALDEIDERWGRYTIAPGTHLLGSKVIDRVGFGNAHHAAATLKN